METKKAAAIISENLTAIYGYAFGKLYDKADADDLAGEIVCAILSSAKNLQDENAFWGFAWRIAENTFRSFIRKKERCVIFDPEEKADEIAVPSPEEELIEEEQGREALSRLRRELAFLTKTNREVTVAYYLHEKSCSEIAKEQGISIDMVKYHLFKTRKLLKEGIGMTRTFGEKSYNPGVFRMDFWGEAAGDYWQVFRRKLPGSIVLAAYDTAMTAEELMMELGVAAPYLEDELEQLVKRGILCMEGKKYRTNIVIITEAYEKEFAKKTEGAYAALSEELFAMMQEALPAIRELDFHGKDYDDNRLLWNLLSHALWQGYCRASVESPETGERPTLLHGAKGYVYGYDHIKEHHHFKGIAGRNVDGDRRTWFTSINFSVAESAQFWPHSDFYRNTKETVSAILGEKGTDQYIDAELAQSGIVELCDGVLSARFPVFEEKVYEAFLTLAEPVIARSAAHMIAVSDLAETMLAEHSPVGVRAQCGDIAKIHHRCDVIALVMEKLVEMGKLTVPTEKTPVGIVGVIR